MFSALHTINPDKRKEERIHRPMGCSKEKTEEKRYSPIEKNGKPCNDFKISGVGLAFV